MSIIPFDSLAYARALEEAGMPRAQAEALGRQQQKTVEDIANSREVARREDIDRLAAQMREGDNRLALQMKEMDNRLSLRIQELDKRLSAQIQELDKRLTGQIQELDLRLTSRMDEKIAMAKYDLIKWMVGIAISGAALVSALAIGAFTFLSPYLDVIARLGQNL